MKKYDAIVWHRHPDDVVRDGRKVDIAIYIKTASAVVSKGLREKIVDDDQITVTKVIAGEPGVDAPTLEDVFEDYDYTGHHARFQGLDGLRTWCALGSKHSKTRFHQIEYEKTQHAFGVGYFGGYCFSLDERAAMHEGFEEQAQELALPVSVAAALFPTTQLFDSEQRDGKWWYRDYEVSTTDRDAEPELLREHDEDGNEAQAA